MNYETQQRINQLEEEIRAAWMLWDSAMKECAHHQYSIFVANRELKDLRESREEKTA